MSPLTEPTKLTLRKSWQPMDPDAAAYITAVEAADTAAGQSGGLEEKTKIAIDNFVLGCKADGIWNAIKASCILAGARTLQGALVPLVGTAPTNFNFVSGDYNRKTGLVGNGSTKYLDSGRVNNADPQDNQHLCCYISTLGSTNHCIGTEFFVAGDTAIANAGMRSRAIATFAANRVAGFNGLSRSQPANAQFRQSALTTTVTGTSQAPTTSPITVFALGGPVANPLYGNPLIAFYSIGEALDLQKLDSRVTDLITAIGVAF